MIRGTRHFAIRSLLAILTLGVAFFSFAGAQAPPTGLVALTGARIIDGTGRAPVAQGTLVIQDGRISAIGPSSAVTIPAGAMRIALSGKTIIPGLINAHGHLDADRSNRPARDRHPAGNHREFAVATVVGEHIEEHPDRRENDRQPEQRAPAAIAVVGVSRPDGYRHNQAGGDRTAMCTTD